MFSCLSLIDNQKVKFLMEVGKFLGGMKVVNLT